MTRHKQVYEAEIRINEKWLKDTKGKHQRDIKENVLVFTQGSQNLNVRKGKP